MRRSPLVEHAGLLMSLIVLPYICSDGAILSLYGHALADRYLRTNLA